MLGIVMLTFRNAGYCYADFQLCWVLIVVTRSIMLSVIQLNVVLTSVLASLNLLIFFSHREILEFHFSVTNEVEPKLFRKLGNLFKNVKLNRK